MLISLVKFIFTASGCEWFSKWLGNGALFVSIFSDIPWEFRQMLNVWPPFFLLLFTRNGARQRRNEPLPANFLTAALGGKSVRNSGHRPFKGCHGNRCDSQIIRLWNDGGQSSPTDGSGKYGPLLQRSQMFSLGGGGGGGGGGKEVGGAWAKVTLRWVERVTHSRLWSVQAARRAEKHFEFLFQSCHGSDSHQFVVTGLRVHFGPGASAARPQWKCGTVERHVEQQQKLQQHLQ